MIRESIRIKLRKGNILESIIDNIVEKTKYSDGKLRKKHRQIIGQKRRLQYYKKLRKEIYEPVKQSLPLEVESKNSKKCKKIWFMWLQGMDKAPEVVQACKKSIISQLCTSGDWELVELDRSNISEYVTMPEFIEEKFAKGIIRPALYSDLVRLKLLRQYGGLWIDSTVFLTGNRFASMFNECELFMPNGYYFFSGEIMTINSWMIYAKSHNRIIELLQACLLEYWRKYDYEIDYFIFHLFSTMIFEDFPEDFSHIPFLCQHASEYLQMLYHDDVDETVLDSIVQQTDVHKLNYKDVVETERTNTYYHWIINRY